MSADPQLLQEKALLLITRERELNTLRNKHQRLLNWLALSQSLPQVVDQRLSLAEIGAKFVTKIVAVIKLQRVQLLELAPDGVRLLGRETAACPSLSAEVTANIRETRSGMTNEPASPTERALAEVVKVHRMLWYRIDACPGRTVLLVGGFDQQRASSYMPFDQEDAEHFAHAGQHFESLLRNVLLLKELEEDKQRLERFNDELEDRVSERTLQLAQANQEISNALTSLRQKDRRISEDLEQARTFQQNILPLLPQSDRIEFGAAYRALDMVGGDIYDVARLRADKYRVFVADATGHGVQASLRTIVIKSEYDRLKHSHETPESLLIELNERLVRTYSETEVLCTACCCDIVADGDGANLRYANAAHPPLLIGRRSAVDELYESGPFLGLASGAQVRAIDKRLEPGELVVASTDGVSEQLGQDGSQFNLREAIERHVASERPLPQALCDVCDSFDQFRGTVAQGDDFTLIAARIARPATA
jgi:serine phosphatase RsbU (regulator of sigma subunit)